MTIPSKFPARGPPKKYPDDGGPVKLSKSEIAAVVMVSAPRRRRPEPGCSVRSTTSLITFLGCVLLIDVFAVLTVDPEHPGPFRHFTGQPPTFYLCMMIALHTITLVCGLSRTIGGCRVAMAIAWLLFMFALGLLIFTPAFIGSYAASGLAPLEELTSRKHDTPMERFYAAFYMAIGAQFFMFILLLASVFQMTLINELLTEAHLRAKNRRQREKASEEALVPPQA